MTKLLAGMIAEPAFLSEYTVFALDRTKQPNPQNQSVVSPLPIPSSGDFDWDESVLALLEGKICAASC